jgi:hypothetical protein
MSFPPRPPIGMPPMGYAYAPVGMMPMGIGMMPQSVSTMCSNCTKGLKLSLYQGLKTDGLCASFSDNDFCP